MKIIFLDIDGVLNCEQGYIDRSCEYIDGPGFKYQKFYHPSKELLNKLIEESGAKIVISSSWRKDGLQRMQEIWKAEEMSGEVIDTTPSLYLQKTDQYNSGMVKNPNTLLQKPEGIRFLEGVK